MNLRFQSREDLPFLLVLSLLSTTLFGWAFGFDLANPLYCSWILSGDSLVHFMGFQSFLKSAWSLPPGVFSNYNAPVGTSLVYTDSIPVLSLLLKTLGPKTVYQFHGLWIWGCWVAQMVCGYFLVRQAGQSRGVSFFGSCLIGTLPCFLARATGGIRHYTLLAHFMILLPLLLFFAERTGRRVHSTLTWGVLLALGLGIHFYLFFFMTILYALVEIQHSKGLKPRLAHGWIAILLIVTAWIYGYFSIPLSSVNHGLAGEVSMNLLSLLTPFRSERYPTQIEGYVFLGYGLLFLSAMSLGLRENRIRIIESYGKIRCGWESIAIQFLLLYALSIYFPVGEWRLNRWLTLIFYGIISVLFFFRVQKRRMLPAMVWGVLLTGAVYFCNTYIRSSGRAGWVLVYLWIFALFSLRLKPVWIGVALALQLFSVIPWLQTIRNDHLALRHQGQETTRPAEGALRESLKRAHSVFLYRNGNLPEARISWLALEHRIPIGPSYVARTDSTQENDILQSAQKTLRAGRPTPGILYIIGDPGLWSELESRLELDRFRHTAEGIRFVFNPPSP